MTVAVKETVVERNQFLDWHYDAGYQAKLTYQPNVKVAPVALPDCHIDLQTVFFGLDDGVSPDTEG